MGSVFVEASMGLPDLDRAVWRKSVRSGSGEDCVEVARVHDVYAGPRLQNPSGPALIFSPTIGARSRMT
jgi:hypothetical protein